MSLFTSANAANTLKTGILAKLKAAAIKKKKDSIYDFANEKLKWKLTKDASALGYGAFLKKEFRSDGLIDSISLEIEKINQELNKIAGNNEEENTNEEEVAIENLVGNWERVCIENDALGFQVSHCNFFGDREMYINEWNYIEMTFKNGETKFYDFK